MSTGSHLGDLVSALVDGELDAEEEKLANAHLDECRSCSAELSATLEMRSVLRSLPPVGPRRPLVAWVPAVGRRSRAAGLVAAAAASVALLVLSGVERDSPSAPQVSELVQVHSTAPVNLDPMSQLAPAVIPVSLER